MRGLSRPGPWKRGPVLAALALLLGLVMLLHAEITDWGGLGSLLETFLPWFGLFIPVLLAAALWRRSAAAVVALLLPVVVWLSLFGGLLLDKSRSSGDLTVVSHNVNEENPDPRRTARALAASGADVLAVEELASRAQETYRHELAAAYPYSEVRGGVGLWSRYPLEAVEPVEIMPWTRALRATVRTPKGPVAVYAAHLASVRVHPAAGFTTARRNEAAAKLAEAVRAERLPRVVVLGDFNGSVDDSALDVLTGPLRSAQQEAGDGFGFTWPASFPVARIDQILVRGVEPTSSWVLPATGSDHLPVAAGISW
ncbi:endonuclease/exonuclease/phosphatase family protein [Streptomyces sp. NPDC057757]|uniref:endonuclease/exonuclease/phosphatase family protein n=1 Tax=Streptomyces sp. NPDC057757 TaxID=3346241 RepID=UPI0036A56411